MRIPLVEELPPDIRVPRGPYEGKHRYYKTALLNTLVHLRPRACLEIGTWKGGSAKIFERYFEEYQSDGALVTADIKKYTNVSSKRVVQVRVYPHTLDIFSLHPSVAESDLLPDWREKVDRSVEENACLLLAHLIGAKHYDFVFVDGDHRNLLKDLEIAKGAVKPPGYALLDDTQTEMWDCCRVYHDDVKHRYNHYDFEDWPIFTGTSLIWEAS